MAKDEFRNKNNLLAWGAIGISILAFIMAFVALNQKTLNSPANTSDLQTRIRELQQQFEISRVRQRLEDLRQEVAGGNADLVKAQREIENSINELKIRLQNTGKEAQQSWQQLGNQLNQIQIGLREGSVNVLDALDRIIDALKANIKT
ncbi:MAG: hypothetical protein HY424_00895 [Candidatus Levybacteria bacterium]|nr:hypothetical protein [Candidatus Levybacteria bacterium]